MKKLLALSVLSLSVLAFGCQQKAQTPAPGGADSTAAETAAPAAAVNDSAIVAELTQAQTNYAQAWNNKDMNFISNNWSHDADIALIPPATRDRLLGWEAVQKWYQDNFNAMDKIDFKIHDLKIKVTPDGNSAVITYYVENDFTDKATGKAMKSTPRVCVVKTKENGEWKQIYGDASFSVAELTKKK
jgi:ketosteroid isomerase-like protein